MTTHNESTEPEKPFNGGNVSEACLNDVLNAVLDATYVTDSWPIDSPEHEFRASTNNVLYALGAQARDDTPVTVAIDTTTIEYDCFGDAGDDTDAAGGANTEQPTARIGLIAAVNTPKPVLLGVEPIETARSDEQSEPPTRREIVRSLLDQATELVEIDTVLTHRNFHADGVLAELDERGLTFIIPARKVTPVRELVAIAADREDSVCVTAGIKQTNGDPQYSAYAAVVPTDGNHIAFLTDEEPHPGEFEALADRHKQFVNVVSLAKTFRRRLSTKGHPADCCSDCWTAAVDVNANQLTHHFLSERLDQGEGYFLGFDRFFRALHCKRQQRTGGDSDEHSSR